MSSPSPGARELARKAATSLRDPEVDARYPNRTHFVASSHPEHGEMAGRALFAGDPVVIVYPDGHELLLRPEPARGPAAVLLRLAALWLRLRNGRPHDGTAFQLPPRTRIEARDSSGTPIAA